MTGGGRRTGPAGAAMPRIACLLAPLRLLALVGLLGPGCGPADGAASPGLTPEEERQVLVHTVAVPVMGTLTYLRDRLATDIPVASRTLEPDKGHLVQGLHWHLVIRPLILTWTATKR